LVVVVVVVAVVAAVAVVVAPHVGATGVVVADSSSQAAGASAEGVMIALVSVVVLTAVEGAAAPGALPAHPVTAAIPIAATVTRESFIARGPSARFMGGSGYHRFGIAQLEGPSHQPTDRRSSADRGPIVANSPGAEAAWDDPVMRAVLVACCLLAIGASAGDAGLRVRSDAVAGDLPVYVVRAADGVATRRAVFLTGSCTTPLTYLRAFRAAASEHGGIVALQGDKTCRDGTRRWSPDTLATSERIDAALRAVGIEDATDVTLVGYSQGAERAEWLAHRFPLKYTRFVLMAGPIVPSRARLAEARGVVTIAGFGDVRENMANGARRLRRSAIPAIYMELPGLQHGELSPAAGAIVAKAFDWLDANALAGAPRPRARGIRARHVRAR
jgi:pimeloyl-ACP methyl ester carboxylesterase